MGCADVAAIRHLLMSDQLRHRVGEAIEIGSLSAYHSRLAQEVPSSYLSQRMNHWPNSRKSMLAERVLAQFVGYPR